MEPRHQTCLLAGVLALGAALASCGQAVDPSSADAGTPTVTRTVTVTQTVTVAPLPTDLPELPTGLPELPPSLISVVPASPDDDAADPSAFRLRVHRDGCGVIRTPGDDVNLTWSIFDDDRFQVAGINATALERYRYYRPGHFKVRLTAFHDGAYRRVSNTVEITC